MRLTTCQPRGGSTVDSGGSASQSLAPLARKPPSQFPPRPPCYPYSPSQVIPPNHALSTACALARALPKFSAKSAKPLAPGAEPPQPGTVTAGFATLPEGLLSDAAIEALAACAEGTRLAAEIVDTPPEQMNTDTFRALAKLVAESLGASVKYEEVVGEELASRGFGGIYNVGKAALQPPAMVVLTYTPEGAPTGSVAWVGKGIIYDTGGLALKTRDGMCGMKSDCGGAAGMLGAFQAAVRCKATQKVSLVLCLAENAIGPGAFRNDDILTLFSGKTVEINNTDAEGRLVLGDGVAYASQVIRPDLIVDMATLTGAQMIATGKRHAGMVANTEEVELAAVAAGKRSGDLVHPLPYCPEAYRAEFASKARAASHDESGGTPFAPSLACCRLWGAGPERIVTVRPPIVRRRRLRT